MEAHASMSSAMDVVLNLFSPPPPLTVLQEAVSV